MQAYGSSQVSPQSAALTGSVWTFVQPSGAEAEVCLAGVAQLVEHLFCKQVVRGSSPRASSKSKVSESCPSGQREQAVNLPAYAYAGSNPALSTAGRLRRAAVSISFLGSSAPPRRSEFGGAPPQVLGSRPKNFQGGVRGRTWSRASRTTARMVGTTFAGVAQLVERQPSKLNVEGSNPFSRSHTRGAQASGRPDSHDKVTGFKAHLAQLVEHVLGKDEVTSSILVVGSKR
jgi:hypothetical protein